MLRCRIFVFQMIDIICPLGTKSHWFDNELRYSLRSIEIFANGAGNVFIVGEHPAWMNSEPQKQEGIFINNNHIIHIPTKDKFGSQRNIHEKIKLACLDKRVSDDFLFWNDDFFLMDFIDCENYPYHRYGILEDKISKRIANDGYRRAMENSQRFLKEHDRCTMYYDIHCPIIYNKKKYLELMDQVDWSVPNGYVIKSLYANYWQVPSVFMPDLKITADTGLADIHEKIKGRHIFSISDGIMLAPAKTMKIYLEETYNKKSKYER